jgi:hypothetical protein
MAKSELRAKLGLDGKDFRRGMQRAKRLAAGFGKAMVAAGAVAAAAFVKATFATAAAADEIGKTAKRVGFGTKALQEWSMAAQFAGADLSDLEKSVKRMNVNILDFGDGLSTPTLAFKKLGLELSDLKGKKPEEAFTKIVKALAGVEDLGERGALADKIFGRGGGKILPLIVGGVKELEATLKRAQRVGFFTKDEIEKSEEFLDNVGEIKKRLTISVGKELIKSMDEMGETFRLLEAAANQFGESLNLGSAEDAIDGINKALQSLIEGGAFRDLADLINSIASGIKKIQDFTGGEVFRNERRKRTAIGSGVHAQLDKSKVRSVSPAEMARVQKRMLEKMESIDNKQPDMKKAVE